MLINISIRRRIWAGFLALVGVFIINAILTIVTLNQSRALYSHISTVIDPSQQYIQDFKAIIIESKMYTTNWVFLRSDIDDKSALKRLHDQSYPEVHTKALALFSLLNDKKIADSLANVFTKYEKLIQTQKEVMSTLKEFEDYDDPVKKMSSEQIIEDQIIPQTADILNKLYTVEVAARSIKNRHYTALKNYSFRLTTFIPLLSVFIIILGVLMSLYFSKIITKPLKSIATIIKSLGKGVINKVEHKETGDEIGIMVKSVNNLSDKLRETALFAQAIGSKKYSVAFSPLSDEDILGKSLITMRDNVQQSEEVLLATNDELKKSNQELDKFVYSVSHDLRAPLSSMLGVVSLIESETTDKDIAPDIKLLKKSINKLDGFIGDILDYSRNSRMELTAQEIDFKITLDEIKDNLKHMASSNSNVDVRITLNTQIPFQSDRTRLSIILNNLISNAIRYSNPMATSSYVSVDINTDASGVTIIIEDNGIGIARQECDKIFDMFYRVSKKSVGSGLGLYIVKETVNKLHGTLQLESEIDKGSKFIITLPRIIDP